MAGMPMPPVMPGSPTGTPTMPGNVAGQPPAMGGGPMISPGAGAGNQAAAVAQLKAIMSPMHRALAAFAVGSKEYRAVLSALKALSPIFGEAQDGNLVPAAAQQIMQAARSGQSPLASVAPGIKPSLPMGAPPAAGAPALAPAA